MRLLIFLALLIAVPSSAKLWFTSKPAASSFTPASIAGLRVWLDFSNLSTITKDGGNNVSAVSDLSGNGFTFAQGTGAQQPLWVSAARNGLDVLQFDGSNDMLSANTVTDLTEYTIVMVTKPTSNRQYNTLIGSNTQTSGQMTFEIGSQTNLDFYVIGSGAVAGTGSNSFPTNTWQRVSATYSATGGGNAGPTVVYLNNVSSATGNTSGSRLEATNMTLGYDGGAGFYAYAGQIAEVIIYDNVISAGNRTSLDAYLVTKWGF